MKKIAAALIIVGAVAVVVAFFTTLPLPLIALGVVETVGILAVFSGVVILFSEE